MSFGCVLECSSADWSGRPANHSWNGPRRLVLLLHIPIVLVTLWQNIVIYAMRDSFRLVWWQMARENMHLTRPFSWNRQGGKMRGDSLLQQKIVISAEACSRHGAEMVRRSEP